MRHLHRSVIIGTLAVAATALAGVQANKGGVVNPNVGQQNGQLTIREQFEQAYPGGQLLMNGNHLRRVWGRQFSNGATPHDSVESFMRKWSALWGVPFSQLQPTGPFQDGAHMAPLMNDGAGGSDFTAVYWSQQVRGVPVFRSHVWGLVGNESDFPMVLAGGTLRNLGNFPSTIADRDLNPSTLDPSVYAGEAVSMFEQPPVITSPRYVVWAGIDTQDAEPKLAVEFIATVGEG